MVVPEIFLKQMVVVQANRKIPRCYEIRDFVWL